MNSGRQKWVWDLGWDPGRGGGVAEGLGIGILGAGGTGGLGAGSERYCRDQTCSSKGLGEESVEELRESRD